jgi:hypothetical protein
MFDDLPIRNHLTLVYALSLVIAILFVAASLGGLLFSTVFYPTDELIQSFLANDLINIIVGLPILAGSMWLSRRGSLAGLLLWPGALLYVLYNYIVYVFGTPFSSFTPMYLSLVILCSYGIISILRIIDWDSVMDRVSGKVPVRAPGLVLAVFGVLFLIRAIGVMMGKTTIPISEMGLLIADSTLSFPMIGGGVLLIRRKPLGYAGGLGLLFAASALFVGLIMALVLQPVFTDEPFLLIDVIVVSVMGLIFFIPLGIFLRGVKAE